MLNLTSPLKRIINSKRGFRIRSYPIDLTVLEVLLEGVWPRVNIKGFNLRKRIPSRSKLLILRMPMVNYLEAFKGCFWIELSSINQNKAKYLKNLHIAL